MKLIGYQTQTNYMGLAPIVGSVKFIGPGVSRQSWAEASRLSDEQGLVVVYRHWRHAGDQPLSSPRQNAKDFTVSVLRELWSLQNQPKNLLVEGYNETGLWDDADRYSEWTGYCARYLADAGYKHLAKNFPTSEPSGYFSLQPGETIEDWAERSLRPYWQHYLPGLEEVNRLGGALGLHEYLSGWNDSMIPWHFGRHRLVHQVLPSSLKNIPIWLTEFGYDWELQGRNTGWRDRISPEDYGTIIKQAAAYLKEGRQQGILVQGLHIFGAGMGRDWSTFDSAGNTTIAEAIREANKEEEPVPSDQIEAWLVDMWRRQGVEPNTRSDPFFAYALEVARGQQRAIVPLLSRDGNYLNYSDPAYVVAYTIPPMWAPRPGGLVREGLPPLV